MRQKISLILFLAFTIIYAQKGNWINVSSPVGKISSFITIDNGIILLGTTTGIWKSTNIGFDWVPLNVGLEEKNIIALGKMNDQLFAGTSKGLFRSTNKGSNWTKCSLPDSNYNSIISTASDLICVKAYPGNLYISSNSGESWKEIILGDTESEIKNFYWSREILSDNSGNLFIAADSASFLYSKDNGSTWSKEFVQNTGRGFRSRLFINGEQLIFRTGNDRLFHTKELGKDWKELITPGGRYKYIYMSHRGSLILQTKEPDNMYESFDSGLSWRPISDLKNIKYWERISKDSLLAIDENYFEGSMLLGSTDGGTNWTNFVSSFADATILTIGPDNYLYAGTEWSGVYRSSDFGITWYPILNEAVIKDITFVGNDLVAIATLDGVYLLTDNCKTIRKASENGLNDDGVIALISTRSGVLFAGSYSKTVEIPHSSGGKILGHKGGGLWRSTDLGNSWERILLDNSVKTPGSGKTWLKLQEYSQKYKPTDQPDLTINSIGISPDGVLLVDADIDYRHRFFSSTDDGQTWTKIRDLDLYEDARTNLVKTSQGEIFTGHGLLFSGISRSSDGGKIFNDVVNGLPSGDLNELISIPEGDVLCATSDGIYYLPFNGNTWSCVAFRGEPVKEIIWYGEYIFASVIFKDENNKSGVYRIPLKQLKEIFPSDLFKEEVWTEINHPFQNNLRLFEIDNSGDYWAIDDSKNLKHSTDEGKNWKTLTLPDDFIFEFEVDTKNKTIWLGTYEGLFRSTSGGEAWTKVELPVIVNDEIFNSVLAEAIYLDANGDILVATAESGPFRNPCSDTTKKVLSYFKPVGFDKIGRLYISKDGGNEWQLMEADLRDNPSSLFRSKSGKLFCTVSGSGLFYSINNGAEWTDCNAGLLPKDVIYMCNFGADADRSVGSVNTLDDGTIYVVRGARGIARTFDEGVNWEYLSAPGEYVWDVYVGPEKNIYAATDMGVFKTENNGNDWTSFSAGLLSSSISSLIRDRKGYIIAVAGDGRIYKTLEKIDDTK